MENDIKVSATNVDWLNVFNTYAKDYTRNRDVVTHKYIVSWWLRLYTGFSTATINYHLDKLVKSGVLTKSAQSGGTLYFKSIN